MEPQKPFACTILDCGMTFTNEDHLHVHTKKHDMVLQLGMEQKAAFAADQTPTPTRFIRNCEEVGLFQDLQNVSVNPFDEGFKRAMETKHGVLSLETSSSEDVLHTPHLVFPLDGDCAMYTANNKRNITISRSSSDESGAVKEYETTTISKLTNEVTTISRVVKPETETKVDKKDVETVSYTNNVIKIHEIRKDGIVNIEKTKEPIDKTNEAKKDNEKVKIPPIMSQQSLDYVVDSLTNDVSEEKRSKIDHKVDKKLDKTDTNDDIEVIVKLPNGKRVKMKAVDEKVESNPKQKLRSILKNKNKPQVVPAPVKDWCIQKPVISCGTLIPVTLRPIVRAVPLVANSAKLIVKQKSESVSEKVKSSESVSEKVKSSESVSEKVKSSESVTEKVKSSESVSEKVKNSESVTEKVKSQEELLDEKRSYSSASSKRYRERMKEEKHRQNVEIQKLRDENVNLSSQVTLLQQLIARHINKCPIADDLKHAQGEIWKIQRVTKTS